MSDKDSLGDIMNDEQFEQIVKGINVHTDILSDIRKSVRTIATLMVLGVVLGLLLGFCSAVGI